MLEVTPPMIKFTVEGKPGSKGRPRFTTAGGHARTYTCLLYTSNIIKYSEKVRALAQVWNRFAAFQPDTLGDKEQAEDEAI